MGLGSGSQIVAADTRHKLIVGLIGQVLSPGHFDVGGKSTSTDSTTQSVTRSSNGLAGQLWRALLVSVICLTLWFGPILLAAKWAGRDSVYVQSSLFFSKAAVVTFGGAYSVLSYVDQQAVDRFQWLEKGEMVDGLGLAETTPGPLIMVVQFVGFLAAWRHGTGLSPLWAGTVNSVLTTWVTFVPCFFWIFLGAPFVERLLAKKWLSAALTAITASVVGVIATLAVTFAVNTLFGQHSTIVYGFVHVTLPRLQSIRFDACVVTALAFLLTFAFHRGLAVTLSACVAVGWLILKLAG